jgi:hypothetical protein
MRENSVEVIMKKALKICVLVAFVLISLRATCGPTRPFTEKPELAIKFADYVYFHNASITFNGKYYYTINGGNDSYCTLNEYDTDGNFIDSYDVGLDGRAIFYNPTDKKLYVKIYGTELYSVDLFYEEAEIEYSDIFKEENSSPAMSPNGKYYFELASGKIRMLDASTGTKVKTINIDKYYDEHGYNGSIAASDHYIFVWNDEDEIIVYDYDGELCAEIAMPRPGYGFSLSYCKNLLWIATDADASTSGDEGTWFGYRLK